MSVHNSPAAQADEQIVRKWPRSAQVPIVATGTIFGKSWILTVSVTISPSVSVTLTIETSATVPGLPNSDFGRPTSLTVG